MVRKLILALGGLLIALYLIASSASASCVIGTCVPDGPLLAPLRIPITTPAGTTGVAARGSAEPGHSVFLNTRAEPGPTGQNWTIQLVPFASSSGRIAPFENSTLELTVVVSPSGTSVFHPSTLATVPSSSCQVSKAGKAACRWNTRVALSRSVLTLTLERKATRHSRAKGKQKSGWIAAGRKRFHTGPSPIGGDSLSGKLAPPAGATGTYRLRAELSNFLIFEGGTEEAGRAVGLSKLRG